jgi:hypothetical protein
MDAVSSLMQERQRFEAWISSLESKRAITPPHVYERVRADYEARLREVVQKLAGRTGELKETVAALTARMARLQTEENAKRDELYEAELRATVGEFESDKWEALRRNIDETITRLANERTGVSTELARVQQILSMSGGTTGMPAVDPNGTGDRSGTAAKGGRFDELAFLSSVVESGPRAGSAGNAAPPGGASHGSTGAGPANSPPAQAAPTEPPSAAPPRMPSGQPAPATAGARLSGSQPAQPQPVAKPSVDTTNAVPSYLRDVPKETAKSLKCHECGTMNSPTEWYCERCGGELAAM